MGGLSFSLYFDMKYHLANCEFRQPTIRDLLALTVSIAMFVSIYSWVIRMVFADQMAAPFQAIFVFLQSCICGIFVVSLFWFIAAKKTCNRHFLHPGYWLIAIQGLSALAQFFPFLVFALFQWSGSPPVQSLFFILSALFSLTGWLVALHGAIKHTGWWRFFFVLMLVPTLLIQFIFARFVGPQQLTAVALIHQGGMSCFLLLPIISDIRKSVIRDWIHWLGVALALLMMFIAPVIFYVVYLVMPSVFGNQVSG